MPYLLDTNVLLRFAHRADPQHLLVRGALRRLSDAGESLHVVPQNLYEMWADRLLRLTQRLFPLLPDTPDVFARWQEIVVQAGVSGVEAHDARLVAAMRAHGLTHILTLNTTDFARYAGSPYNIVARDPASV